MPIVRYMDGEPAGKHWPDDRVSEFLDQISEAGEDYRRLVERLPAIVYACEVGENGRWRYVSPQIEEILGYTPEEWVADPTLWARQLHPEDRDARPRPGAGTGGGEPSQRPPDRLSDAHPRGRRRLDPR